MRADPGARGATQLEVKCLKGYGAIKRLGITGLGFQGLVDFKYNYI